MRLFISAGESGGDLYAAGLIHELRLLCPEVKVQGFGGERMAAAGCWLVHSPDHLPRFSLAPVLMGVPSLLDLLGKVRRCFERQRPDAVVLVGEGGLHRWLAGCARTRGVPVVHFRTTHVGFGAASSTSGLRGAHLVLCNQPSEEAWLEQRGIRARWVGHPAFDLVRQQRLDESYVAQQCGRGTPIVALLPGTRTQELRYNLPSLLRAAAAIHAERPQTRFLVGCLKPEHARAATALLGQTRLPVEVHVERTSEIIEVAHSCMAVSGPLCVELLYRARPSVLVSRRSLADLLRSNPLGRSRHTSLVNQLAGKTLFPEHRGWTSAAGQMSDQVCRWLADDTSYQALCGELRAVRDRIAQPGVSERAARAILELVGNALPQARAV